MLFLASSEQNMCCWVPYTVRQTRSSEQNLYCCMPYVVRQTRSSEQNLYCWVPYVVRQTPSSEQNLYFSVPYVVRQTRSSDRICTLIYFGRLLAIQVCYIVPCYFICVNNLTVKYVFRM